MHRKDRYWLIGLATAVVFFAAISITVNALAPDVPTLSNTSDNDARVQDSIYVLALDSLPGTALSQQDAITLGRSTCAAFDRGDSPTTVLATAAQSGLTPEQAANLIKAAIDAYCPRHRQLLVDDASAR
jgi:hypothetical protein